MSDALTVSSLWEGKVLQVGGRERGWNGRTAGEARAKDGAPIGANVFIRRFFTNNAADGFTGHTYGRSLLEGAGGVAAAWADVAPGFDVGHFSGRGGVYDWGQSAEALREQKVAWSPPA